MRLSVFLLVVILGHVLWWWLKVLAKALRPYTHNLFSGIGSPNGYMSYSFLQRLARSDFEKLNILLKPK